MGYETMPDFSIELESIKPPANMWEDYRLKLLSYSSMHTFDSCPRKRFYAAIAPASRESALESRLTFEMGHLTGYAIQILFENPDISFNEYIWKLFTSEFVNPGDMITEDAKRKKSFFYAMHAATIFYEQVFPPLSQEYELLRMPDGTPATELSFVISQGDFHYRGFIDVVVRHKESGNILVVENKTSSSGAIPEYYKFSPQSSGYSVVVDMLLNSGTFGEADFKSSFEALYIIYDTKEYNFTLMPFVKSTQTRLDFLKTLLLKFNSLDAYIQAQHFPQTGNCTAFGRTCPAFTHCDASPEYLYNAPTKSIESELENYKIRLKLEDCFAFYTSL